MQALEQFTRGQAAANEMPPQQPLHQQQAVANQQQSAAVVQALQQFDRQAAANQMPLHQQQQAAAAVNPLPYKAPPPATPKSMTRAPYPGANFIPGPPSTPPPEPRPARPPPRHNEMHVGTPPLPLSAAAPIPSAAPAAAPASAEPSMWPAVAAASAAAAASWHPLPEVDIVTLDAHGELAATPHGLRGARLQTAGQRASIVRPANVYADTITFLRGLHIESRGRRRTDIQFRFAAFGIENIYLDGQHRNGQRGQFFSPNFLHFGNLLNTFRNYTSKLLASKRSIASSPADPRGVIQNCSFFISLLAQVL